MATLHPDRPGRVTTRHDAALAGHGRLLPVDVFTTTEAGSYLATKFHSEPHQLDEAEELAECLGRLPVALAQAAAYMADLDLICARYRQLFADHPLATLAPDAWPTNTPDPSP